MRSSPRSVCTRLQLVKGFTLIEVMIVVAVIGILTAIAYPSYMDSVRKGWRAEARSALMQEMQQQERYFTQVGKYKAAFKAYSGDSDASSKYAIASGNCDGNSDIKNCVKLTATLKSGSSDPQVGNLWINSMGDKGCSGSAADRCWK